MSADSPSYRTATVAVLFCDLVDSTARLTRLGDAQGDVFRRKFIDALTQSASRCGGTVVKHLGDGIMVVFERSTISALECARLMHGAVDGLEREDPVAIRVGVSAGEVIEEDGDWFGTPVVEAARLCNAAEAGETLAPALVESLVGSRGAAHEFRVRGSMELKGLAAPVAVVRVDPQLPKPSRDPQGHETPEPAQVARGGSRRKWVLAGLTTGIVATVVAGVMVAADGDGDPVETADSARVTTEAIGFGGPVGYTPALAAVDCAPELEMAMPSAKCNELIVPESRDAPDGPTIRLPVVGVEAEDPQTELPVLVLDLNESVAGSSLPAVADTWWLSPRGSPGTSDLAELCPGVSSVWADTLDEPPDSEALVATRSAAAGECASVLEAQGRSRDAYNLSATSLDLRDLAVALGEDEVVVAAGGYVTPAAVAFARTHPDGVHAMLLTNPVPPGESVLGDPSHTLSVQVQRLSDLCEKDDVCSQAFEDLEAQYESTWAELEADPQVIEARSLDQQGPFSVLLDGRRLAKAMRAGFQVSEQVGLIPGAVLSGATELTASAGIHEDVGFFVGEDAPGPAYLSTICSYDLPEVPFGEVAESTMAQYAGAGDAWLKDVCAAWDVPSVHGELQSTVIGSVPTLVAVGGLGVAGANGWGAEMASELDDAVLAEFETLSDDLVFDPPRCLRELRSGFVVDPDTDVDVSACEAESPPLQFRGLPG
ncbi:MAG: adenylate/guanylate cyclase domain-containing protein [Microthrixaceae bacterium]